MTTPLEAKIQTALEAQERFKAGRKALEQATIEERSVGEQFDLNLQLRLLHQQAYDALDTLGQFVIVNKDKIRYVE